MELDYHLPLGQLKLLGLVLGGCHPQILWYWNLFPTLTGVAVMHFQYKMVGYLLLLALQCPSRAFPKVFQSYFEQIFEYINSHLAVSLQYSDDASPLYIMIEWKSRTDGTSPVARRLAAIYFPKSAAFIAACYSSSDQTVSLEAITTNLDAEFPGDVGVPEELMRFRVITASVAISNASRLHQKALPHGQGKSAG